MLELINVSFEVDDDADKKEIIRDDSRCINMNIRK